jgi:hypothetical protein
MSAVEPMWREPIIFYLAPHERRGQGGHQLSFRPSVNKGDHTRTIAGIVGAGTAAERFQHGARSFETT